MKTDDSMKKMIAPLQKLKKNDPNMPESVKAKIDRWERMMQGDAKAIIEISEDCGMTSETEDFPMTFV
jgi:tetrahydromethanopterin S-methyltransferase subunit H